MTNTHQNMICGLVGASTLSATVPIAADSTMANTNMIVFNQAEADGDAVALLYKATGETTVTHTASVKVPVAGTAFKVGLYYNGTTITPYIDGTAGTAITAADIVDGTDVFPAAATCYLTFGTVAAASVSASDGAWLHALRVCQPA